MKEVNEVHELFFGFVHLYSPFIVFSWVSCGEWWMWRKHALHFIPLVFLHSSFHSPQHQEEANQEEECVENEMKSEEWATVSEERMNAFISLSSFFNSTAHSLPSLVFCSFSLCLLFIYKRKKEKSAWNEQKQSGKRKNTALLLFFFVLCSHSAPRGPTWPILVAKSQTKPNPSPVAKA